MRTTGKATDLITFSRSSGGTALRKIAYGPELVTNGTFDTDASGWSIDTARGTISWQSGVLRVTNDQATGFPSAYQLISGLTVGKVYRMSSSVRGTNARLRVTSTAIDIYSASNITSASFVQDSVVFVATATTATVYAYCNEGGNTGNYAEFDNISVKEVLFDQGDLTLFNHPADIPRIEYDANGNVLGLLVEESRTNRFLYSASFSDWVLVRASLSDNTDGIIAPDGSVAKILISDTTPSNSHLTQKNSVTAAANSIACGSVFLKKQPSGIVTHAQIKLTDDAAGASNQYAVMIDLSTGAITDTGTGGTVTSPFNSVQSVGDGWYRVSLGFTKNNTATRTDLQIILSASATMAGTTPIVFSGDGTSGAYIWGAQLEEGAFPTSYIPTAGSTATRAADVASIATSEFGYRDDEGTVVVEASSYEGSPMVSHLNSGSDANRAQISPIGANITGYVQSTGDSGSFLSVSGAAVAPFKAALGIDTNNMGLSAKGSPVSIDTSQNVPVSVIKLNIGSNAINSVVGQIRIKSIKYIPRRLTNDQLQEITS